MVQKEVKKSAPQTLEVLVDDPCAVENITRFASNNGYKATSRPTGDDEFALTLVKKA